MSSIFNNCKDFNIYGGEFKQINGNYNQYTTHFASATAGSYNVERGAASFRGYRGSGHAFPQRGRGMPRSQSQSHPGRVLADDYPDFRRQNTTDGRGQAPPIMAALPDPRDYQPDQFTAHFARESAPPPSLGSSYYGPPPQAPPIRSYVSAPAGYSMPARRENRRTQEEIISSSPEEEHPISYYELGGLPTPAPSHGSSYYAAQSPPPLSRGSTRAPVALRRHTQSIPTSPQWDMYRSGSDSILEEDLYGSSPEEVEPPWAHLTRPTPQFENRPRPSVAQAVNVQASSPPQLAAVPSASQINGRRERKSKKSEDNESSLEERSSVAEAVNAQASSPPQLAAVPSASQINGRREQRKSKSKESEDNESSSEEHGPVQEHGMRQLAR